MAILYTTQQWENDTNFAIVLAESGCDCSQCLHCSIHMILFEQVTPLLSRSGS